MDYITCPYCRHSVNDSKSLVICSKCKAIYHAECGQVVHNNCLICNGNIVAIDNENIAEILIKELQELANERNLIEKELASNVESIVVGDNATVSLNFTDKDPRSLKTWWHNILRKYGKYPCYAVFLLLPSDKEAISYLSQFGKELDLISDKDCLVIAFGKTEFKGPKFDETVWSEVVSEHISEGISITIAKIFNIDFTQFPCLIVFRDIRSPEHVVITLKDFTAEIIAQNMRQVFSIA